MTQEDITTIIEQDFLWLTPDEKQKLRIIIKNVWNDAIDQAKLVIRGDQAFDLLYLNDLKI